MRAHRQAVFATITGISEAMKTAPDGGGTPDPEPHHLAPPEIAGGKMTDPKSTPRTALEASI